MANENRGKIVNFIQQNIVGVATVVGIFFLFIPTPKLIIDVCMVLNLALAIIILLVVLYTPRSSDFQTFPRVVQLQMLFGLVVNISSTRLILTAKNYSAQSDMVKAFADIVAKGDLVIGFLIFIVLILVQVMVITKGATRVAEVQARFSLDSMSQKFFDVDNRLNSGIIDDAEAIRLKDAIRKEIDFYSAMDGSAKFVSGTVKLGIVITLLNLIGGVIVGMIKNGMAFNQAMTTYSMLTIGDGLLSQLPTLMISFATGLLVTGSKSDDRFDDQLKTDFTRTGYIYEILGGILLVFGVALRNGTQFLLIPIGALFIFIGFKLTKTKEREAVLEQTKKEEQKAKRNGPSAPDAEKISMLDPLSLELGYALIPLVNEEKGAELLERITRIRQEAKLDMGFVIPKIRIQDNMALSPNEYCFKIKGIPAGSAEIRLGYYMCMDTGGVVTPMQGEKTKDPTFGMDAIWIPEENRGDAEAAGYVVIDPPTIIATHITEIIRSHAAEMLGRQEVSSILDVVKEHNPVLIDEVLNTAKLTYGQIEKVLQNLLQEKVSIRNIITILETMANYAGVTNSVWELTKKVREALGLQICMQYVDKDDGNKLRVMALSQELAELVQQHAYFPSDGSKPYVAFDPVDNRKWILSISAALSKMNQLGYMPIILCVSSIRQLVKAAIERDNPGVVVLSDMEAYSAGKNIDIEVLDEISLIDE